MMSFIIYLIEASICLVLLYVIYILFIEYETFHKIKRFYLIASLIISLIIPVLPSLNFASEFENTINLHIEDRVTGVIMRNNFIANADDNIISGYSKEILPDVISDILGIIYIFGITLMGQRFIKNLSSIVKLLKSNKHLSYKKYSIIHLTDEFPTFSFLKYIFLNETGLSKQEKEAVLAHEETHIQQGHSVDIVIVELVKVFFWFNPLIQQYKVSLTKVHECLADEAVLDRCLFSPNDYQCLLLKQYLSKFNIELAHQFNYSLIKFRIKMMTKQRSKRLAKYKLMLAIPVILLSLLAFTSNPISLPGNENENLNMLNQVKLCRQFIGTWTFKQSEDTLYIFECKPYENGLDLNMKWIVGERVIIEQKGQTNYDPENDRLILISNDSAPYAMWFISKNTCESGPIHDSDEIIPDRKWEFKASNRLTLSILLDNKYADMMTLTRVKK